MIIIVTDWRFNFDLIDWLLVLFLHVSQVDYDWQNPPDIFQNIYHCRSNYYAYWSHSSCTSVLWHIYIHIVHAYRYTYMQASIQLSIMHRKYIVCKWPVIARWECYDNLTVMVLINTWRSNRDIALWTHGFSWEHLSLMPLTHTGQHPKHRSGMAVSHPFLGWWH